MMNPLLVVLGILALLTGLMWLVAVAGRRWSWSGELSRKVVHVGMGLVCLTFPLLFRETWPVFLLAGAAVSFLVSIRIVPGLKVRLGGVLGGTGRDSWGEIWFPLAVAVVFALRGDNDLLFYIPVLQLTVADAVAAMVGIRHGAHRFATDDGRKSAEGSFAFFFAAFLAATVPLLFFSGMPVLTVGLIGVLLGLGLMLTEAISWRGLDNLFIPLACQVVLQRVWSFPVERLFLESSLLLGMVLVLAAIRRRTHLSRSGAVGAGLVLYGCWLLGGWPWLLGPAATLLGYLLLCPDARRDSPGHHLVQAVFAVALPGVLWLYASRLYAWEQLIYPYSVAYSAQLAMIASAYFLGLDRGFSLIKGWLISLSLAFLLPGLPCWWVWWHHPDLLMLSGAALVLVAVALAIFLWWQPSIRKCPDDEARWWRQGTLATLASLLAFFVMRKG